LRIALEAEAILGVISLAEAGEVRLVFSEAHAFETERNPRPSRRRYALEVIARAYRYVRTDEAVRSLAEGFICAGIKPLDALHLASAVESDVRYFCTCDDRLYRKARQADTRSTRVVAPLELIQELEDEPPDTTIE
jgi:predicted nucleic acid-binding protein